MITTDAKVLMVGPDRSLQGGIVSVVDGYFEAGMMERCGCLDYQGTGVGTNLFTKSAAFAGSLASYLRRVGRYDIVHLHISRDGSYKRKSMMAKIARDRGKKVILHEHSGQFKLDFETRGEAYRDDVRKTFGAADKVVVSGKQLSYQRHQHRGEVWTDVSGTGEIVLDGLVQQVRAGSVVNIGKCRMYNGFIECESRSWLICA